MTEVCNYCSSVTTPERRKRFNCSEIPAPLACMPMVIKCACEKCDCWAEETDYDAWGSWSEVYDPEDERGWMLGTCPDCTTGNHD